MPLTGQLRPRLGEFPAGKPEERKKKILIPHIDVNMCNCTL